MILIEKIPPTHRFSDFIESYVVFKNTSTTESYMIPEGVIELVWSTINSSQKDHFTNTFIQRPNFFLGGLRSKFFKIKTKEKGLIYSVRFKPFGLSFFTKVPLYELKSQFADPREVLSINEEDIDNLNLITSLKSFRTSIEQILLKNFDHNKSHIDNKVLEIKDLKSMLEYTGLSNSGLRYLFNRRFGCAPKQFIQTERTKKAIEKIDICASLTDLAYELGYFDQSHFIHDFKMITGETPTTFRSKKLLYC